MLIVIGSRQCEDADQCAAYLGLHESGSSVKRRAKLFKVGTSDIKAQYQRLTNKDKNKSLH
jgi:hypothetical protein